MQDEEAILCEKCGHEMLPLSEARPVGMTCPNCGWGWATTYTEPIYEDMTEYSVIVKENNPVSKEYLRTISDFLGCNFIEAKKLLEKAPTEIFSGKAYEVKKKIAPLVKIGINLSIVPDYPYDLE